MPCIDDRAAAQIVSIGNGYGGRLFWYEILREDSVSNNIRKALLYIGCLSIPGAELAVRQKLHHPSSRVRSAACKAVSLLKDAASIEALHDLDADPSPRVRTEARRALVALHVKGNGKETAAPEPADPGQPLVLISDDSARVQDQMTQMLTPYDFRLAYASSLPETMEMAHRLLPDAILTDNQKGRDNQSGLRMTGMIAQDEGHGDTGLVMVSADPIAGPFLWEGGDRFFLKPFVPTEALARALRELTVL